MKSSEVLRKAGDVIRERGWHQGSFRSGRTGAVCAWGAINVACNGTTHPAETAMEYEAMRYAEDLVPAFSVSDFNDADGRTVEDVLDLFERAAAVAEESGD